MTEHVHEWAFSVYFPHVYCKCGETMAVKEANLRLNEYETLKAATERLKEYAVLLDRWFDADELPLGVTRAIGAARANCANILEGKDERTKPIR